MQAPKMIKCLVVIPKVIILGPCQVGTMMAAQGGLLDHILYIMVNKVYDIFANQLPLTINKMMKPQINLNLNQKGTFMLKF